MPALPITARQRADAIRVALDATPIGTVSITIDGQSVTYDREKAMQEWLFWDRIAKREAGRSSPIARINLG